MSCSGELRVSTRPEVNATVNAAKGEQRR